MLFIVHIDSAILLCKFKYFLFHFPLSEVLFLSLHFCIFEKSALDDHQRHHVPLRSILQISLKSQSGDSPEDRVCSLAHPEKDPTYFANRHVLDEKSLLFT